MLNLENYHPSKRLSPDTWDCYIPDKIHPIRSHSSMSGRKKRRQVQVRIVVLEHFFGLSKWCVGVCVCVLLRWEFGGISNICPFRSAGTTVMHHLFCSVTHEHMYANTGHIFPAQHRTFCERSHSVDYVPLVCASQSGTSCTTTAQPTGDGGSTHMADIKRRLMALYL